ncbi:MAG: TIM barrel protein [Thermomicrobiales bacterium]
MRQALVAWCLERVGMTTQQMIEAAREIGYGGIELAPMAAWGAIRESGLTIVSARGHESLELGLNRREEHDRIEREIRANLELAVEWRIPVLICFSGNRAGLDDATGIANTALGLRRVARAAEEAGVTLALELLNSRVNHPDYQCDRTAWGRAVCDLVGSSRVSLLYDIYHMQIMEGDVIRTIRDGHGSFGHYHTAGNPGRHEIGDDQELNYPAICRAIAATGYDGWIGQEFVPTGEPIAALREAFARCEVG